MSGFLRGRRKKGLPAGLECVLSPGGHVPGMQALELCRSERAVSCRGCVSWDGSLNLSVSQHLAGLM